VVDGEFNVVYESTLVTNVDGSYSQNLLGIDATGDLTVLISFVSDAGGVQALALPVAAP
jgi:hypothetical protein